MKKKAKKRKQNLDRRISTSAISIFGYVIFGFFAESWMRPHDVYLQYEMNAVSSKNDEVKLETAYIWLLMDL